MRLRDRIGLALRGYFAEMRHQFAESWADLRSEREETKAAIREHRQHTRRLKQLLTGKPNPTRRDVRKATRAWKRGHR